MSAKKVVLSSKQLELIEKYCKDDMKELKKICLPLISLKGVADMEVDDLLSDAMKVLFETAQIYDSSKNDNFGAYLTNNIKRSYKDWTRDRMRDKRMNYARDRNGKIIRDKNGNKVIIKPLTLDAATEEGRNLCETVASDFRVENIFMKEITDEWHQEVKDFLHSISPLQRKMIMMIANKYNKEEICSILHIESDHYDHLFKRMMSEEKIKPLRRLIGGR